MHKQARPSKDQVQLLLKIIEDIRLYKTYHMNDKQIVKDSIVQHAKVLILLCEYKK